MAYTDSAAAKVAVAGLGLSLSAAVERGRSAFLFNAAIVGTEPSCAIVCEKTVTYGCSGSKWSAWNSVTGTEFGEGAEAERKIDEVIAWYKQRKVAFNWWVRESNSPKGLREKLEQRGFRFNFHLTYMARRLDDPSSLPTEKSNADLIIGHTKTESDYLAFWGLVQSVFDAPRSDFTDPWRPQVEAGRGLNYLARYKGEAVGTATAIDSGDGIWAIFNVTVAPRARNLGIASALLTRLLAEGAQKGYKVAVLEATDMGRFVYTKLGFVDGERVYLLESPKA